MYPYIAIDKSEHMFHNKYLEMEGWRAMPKLTITINVPDGIYCGFSQLKGPKCHMCLRRGVDYYCLVYEVRLQSDVSGPLKFEDCEKRTSSLPMRNRGLS